ncbi:hypothetical protein MLD52_16270 [Puniceicoccaceae bacterium K14]|nr:hypothetical protein [Puniceicoccaceae bacterium K14]
MSVLKSNTHSSLQRTRKRDYSVFGLSALLLLCGCYQMANSGGFEDSASVSAFLIGALVACCGYALSWTCSKCWGAAMLLIALVARMIMLPMGSGTEFERLVWDSETLQIGLNPYEEAPVLGRFGTPDEVEWEDMEFSAQSTRFSPLMLWLCNILGFEDGSLQWAKFVFIILDMSLCLALFIRFGAAATSQYAWSPLAIMSVGGMANSDILFLFPMGLGLVLWSQWVEKSGGGSMINSKGGIGGGVGQIVCFVAFLLGVSVALNLLMIPVLVWLVLWVLRKAGLKAGLIALVVGAAPLVLSFLWLSITLEEHAATFIPIKFALKVELFSFLPSIIDWMAGYWLHANSVVFVALVCFAVYALVVNGSIGRMGTIYISTVIMLSPLIQPWYFLWLAPFAIVMGHYGLRVASVFAFVCFLPLRSELTLLTEIELSLFESWMLWAPFVFCSIWFTIKNPARTSGFYVRSF